MSRLKKVALMNPEMFKGTLKQLGNKGRGILKGIEDYKFSLEQAARIVSNDPNLSQKIIEKKKALDKAAGEIYSIVFEIENIDITKEYQDQQNFINNPELKNNEENVPNIPENKNNVPNKITPVNNNQENNTDEKENTKPESEQEPEQEPEPEQKENKDVEKKE